MNQSFQGEGGPVQDPYLCFISILSRGQINSQPDPISANKNSSFARLPELAFVTCQNPFRRWFCKWRPLAPRSSCDGIRTSPLSAPPWLRCAILHRTHPLVVGWERDHDKIFKFTDSNCAVQRFLKSLAQNVKNSLVTLRCN